MVGLPHRLPGKPRARLQRGLALPMGLVVLTLLSLLSIATVERVIDGAHAARAWHEQSQALLVAEAGARQAVAQLKEAPDAWPLPGEAVAPEALGLPGGAIPLEGQGRWWVDRVRREEGGVLELRVRGRGSEGLAARTVQVQLHPGVVLSATADGALACPLGHCDLLLGPAAIVDGRDHRLPEATPCHGTVCRDLRRSEGGSVAAVSADASMPLPDAASLERLYGEPIWGGYSPGAMEQAAWHSLAAALLAESRPIEPEPPLSLGVHRLPADGLDTDVSLALRGIVVAPPGSRLSGALAVEGLLVLLPGARLDGEVTVLGQLVALGEADRPVALHGLGALNLLYSHTALKALEPLSRPPRLAGWWIGY